MKNSAIQIGAAFAPIAIATALATAPALAELKCPKDPTNYGVAVGIGKSCNMVHAPVEDIVAGLASLDWDCAQSDLRALVNGVRDGANWDRYDNHWQICSSMDQYRQFFEKIDKLAHSAAAK